MTSVRAVTTLVAGVFVFGVSFQLTDPWMLMAVFFATLVALYGMGMMLASLYLLYGREAWNLSALLEEPSSSPPDSTSPSGSSAPPSRSRRPSSLAALGLDALRQLLFPGFFGGQFWLLSVGLELATASRPRQFADRITDPRA